MSFSTTSIALAAGGFLAVYGAVELAFPTHDVPIPSQYVDAQEARDVAQDSEVAAMAAKIDNLGTEVGRLAVAIEKLTAGAR